MKLEEGMYVRTKDGEIGKIRVIIDGLVFINTNQYYSTVSKANHNIIDLIEFGDYVNGHRVVEIFEEYVYTEDEHTYEIEDIKTIVTKECFENMSYEVSK